MRESATCLPLLELLVRVYNQPIQLYHYFPDIILCGTLRLDPDDFALLCNNGWVAPYHHDSFGRLFRTTPKAEDFLHLQLRKRRHNFRRHAAANVQASLPF